MRFCYNIVRLKRHYVKIRHLVYACINAKDSLNTVLSTKLTFFFVTKHISKTFFNTFSVFYILIIYFYQRLAFWSFYRDFLRNNSFASINA